MIVWKQVDAVEQPRPFFERGAYTEIDNVPAQKYGLATRLIVYVRCCVVLVIPSNA